MSATGAQASATAALLRRASALRPTLAMVLGSGFHHVLSEAEADVRLRYARLPGFPPVGVAGHAGELVIGRLGGTEVMMLSGRAHFYEDQPMSAVTFPIRVLAAYGITDLLLTNAAGGVRAKLRPGSFMVLTDHINFMGANPLRGAAWPNLQRFVDLSDAYDARLGKLLQRAARLCGTQLQRGVYLAVSGPSYETPAEVRAFARLGADAVGMSTVPEVVVARQCGVRVAALSCITNAAAGTTRAALSHTEVLETASRVRNLAAQIISTFSRLYGRR